MRDAAASSASSGPNALHLGRTPYCDPFDPEIASRAREIAGGREAKEAGTALFDWVREEIAYRVIGLESASATLKRGCGCCVAKSNLVVALARAAGIPARYCFFRGRMASPDLSVAALRVVHVIPELLLEGLWLSGDPAYESALSRAYATGHLGQVTWVGVTAETRTPALPRWFGAAQRVAIWVLPGAWRVRRVVARARKDREGSGS